MASQFLLICDLHDEEEALRRLSKVANDEKVDAVLICGDTTSHSRLFLEEVFKAFAKPLFIIPGNNEEKPILDILAAHRGYVHERTVQFKGFSLVGFGFTNQTPYNTPNELDESTLREHLMNLPAKMDSIVLGHCPPHGMFDLARGKHIGSTAVKEFVEAIQPKVYLCGHVHEYGGVSTIGKTLIIKIPAGCLYRYAILTDNDGTLSVRFGSL